MSAEINISRRRFGTFAARGAVDIASRTVELSFSSDSPVDMGYCTEVLDHSPKSVRLDRINAGGPLLFNHDSADLLGIVEKAVIGGGRGRAVVRFGKDERGEWALQQVADGILINVSFGYRVYKYVEDTTTGVETAIDWEPYEISLVTCPADTSVGVDRSLNTDPSTPATSATTIEVNTMTQVSTGAADHAGTDTTNVSDQQRSAVQDASRAGGQASSRVADDIAINGERNRCQAIRSYCKEHRLDEKLAEKWIANGASVETVANEVLGILAERSKNSANMAAYLDLPESDRKRYSIMKAIRAVAARNWNEAGLELECHRELTKRLGREALGEFNFFVPTDPVGAGRRDLTVGTGNAGGYLVETANMGFIEMLRNSSVVMSMGATRLTGLQGNVAVPKQTGAASAYWLTNEATAITESQQTFGQLTLTPKTVGGYTEYSRLLLLQSSPNAEQLIMADLAKVVALDVDAKALNGSGASGQPTGIINTAGIGSVTGTSIAYAGIIEFQTDTATSNALSDNSGYLATPGVAGLLKQRVKFTSTASPIWEGKLLSGSVDGYRAMASNQVPASNLLFGDFAQVILAEWGALEIEVNPFANFQSGISGVRAMYSVDIGLRIPAAFSLATSVT